MDSISQKPYISILTATYNRRKTLNRTYLSILENTKYNEKIEWLIMDDGSTDDTEELVRTFENTPLLEIRYYKQENKGKMFAINELVKKARGIYTMDLDSDDFLAKDAIKKIKENCFILDNIYAFAFLKSYTNKKIIGKKFQAPGISTKMFNVAFVEGDEGEKALVFNTNIRKKYNHKLEKNEKFITEGRLYNEMDKKYEIFPFNEVIQLCEYQKDGYTKNIKNVFEKNPFGYYEYFKQLLEFDYSSVPLKKRIYVIKHYILFSYISGEKIEYRKIRNNENKLLVFILNVPGRIIAQIKKFKTLEEQRREVEEEKIYNDFNKIEEKWNTQEINLKREMQIKNYQYDIDSKKEEYKKIPFNIKIKEEKPKINDNMEQYLLDKDPYNDNYEMGYEETNNNYNKEIYYGEQLNEIETLENEIKEEEKKFKYIQKEENQSNKKSIFSKIMDTDNIPIIDEMEYLEELEEERKEIEKKKELIRELKDKQSISKRVDDLIKKARERK